MARTPKDTLVDARVHALYCGVTLSGKTTLARHHARLLGGAGYEVVVYDPVATATAGGDWAPDKTSSESQVTIFSDEQKFLRWILKASGEPDRPIFVFVDEAADIFGHANTDVNWLPRRVRHQNIYLRLISQRPKMLPPNVRSQCAHTYMFRLARDDAKIVLADAGHEIDIIPDGGLSSGDFLLLVSGDKNIIECNVFELVL